MQPELPWNVAGIPPEAREAARAAARREGVSVGEWLTRRILKSLSEGSDRGRWTSASEFRAEPQYSATGRETDEMLERVSRSESESNGAYRRIEDQLRNLTRRIEATERTQSENSRAVNQAATEINIATREQTQAFDQLGQHVMGLGDRLARIERGAASDTVKDAVKGLHTGLSRLADQIAETTNQSANQLSALAKNVETVAGKLHDLRTETDAAERSLSARLHIFDERVRAVQTLSQATAEKLDKAIGEIESSRTAQRVERSENERQAQLITELSDALDKLSTRFSTGEAQTVGILARLENQIGSLESRRSEAPFDRRLQGIEHELVDVAGRLETSERNSVNAERAVQENFRNLSTRLDAAEQRQREAVTATHAPAAVQPASLPVAPQTAQASLSPAANFDVPPFADAPPFAQPQQPATTAFNEPPQFSASPFAAENAFEVDGSGGSQPQFPTSADSYIAQARRSALAAAAADAQSSRGLGFTWGAAPASRESSSPKPRRTRFALVAGIAVIAAVAVVAGMMLSRGLVGGVRPAIAPVTSLPASPPPDLHASTEEHAVRSSTVRDSDMSEAQVPPVTESTSQTAPGSPVIRPPRVPPAKPKAPESRPAAALPASPPVQAMQAPAMQPPKTVSALDRLTTLAAAGSSKAELLLGLKYLDGDGAPVNEAEAAKWLERAANKGEAIAAYRLGTLYERGHGVPVDAARAIQWYAAAAKLGNRKAMHNLAVAYAEGSGTQKDLTQAAQWFSKAAALGLADSEFNLAVLYERGMGVQQSLIDAYKWYAIAAAQGDQESKSRLDVIATQLTADERAAAQKTAAEFRPLPLDRDANIPPDPSIVG